MCTRRPTASSADAMHADDRRQANGRPDANGRNGAGAPHWDAARAAALVKDHAHAPGALLPVLHALQEEFGYIDREAAVPIVADALNISRAEVVGTISFYH